MAASGTPPASNAAVIIGALLVLAGSLALLRQLFPGLGAYVAPLLLMILGVLVALAGRR